MREKLLAKGVGILSLVLNIFIVPLGAIYFVVKDFIDRIRGEIYLGPVKTLKLYFTGVRMGTKMVIMMVRGKVTLDEYVELLNETKEEIEDLAEEYEDYDDYAQAINELEDKFD